MEVAATPLLITGWCLLLYAATEFINGFKLMIANHQRKKMEEAVEVENAIEEVTPVEEITSDDQQDKEP